MSERWYTRPVVSVSDTSRALDFYLGQLGFAQDWDYGEDGRRLIAQVSRAGCELILSSQWPERVGRSVTFVSLDEPVLLALRQELEGKGVAVRDGEWGYRLMVVEDPDGNALWFPYPAETAA